MICCSYLQLCYAPGQFPVLHMWTSIRDVFVRVGASGADFDYNGKSIPFNAIEDVLVKSSSTHFSVIGAGYEISAGSKKILIDKDEATDYTVWDEWVAALASVNAFICGFVVDREYYKWQNTEDPFQYELAGKDYSHLPTCSNELPPPLTKQVIDTSRNPGRRILRRDYIEGVGAVMWLGPTFAERTGADLEALRAADWCEVTEFAPGVLRVQTQDHCFTSDEGREAELQNLLRATLFPNAVRRE